MLPVNLKLLYGVSAFGARLPTRVGSGWPNGFDALRLGTCKEDRIDVGGINIVLVWS